MPQTIEGLVKCHELARSRTRRGQPSWAGTLGFMAQLDALATRHDDGDDTLTAQQMLDGFHAAAKEVREKIPEAKGSDFTLDNADLEHFVVSLEQWDLAFVENCPDILQAFDDLLDPFYDWCDMNRWFLTPG